MSHTPLRARLRRLACLLLAALLCFELAAGPAHAALFGEFSVKDEREMGEKFNVLVRSRLPMVEDPEIAGYVREVTQRLADQMPPQPWPVTTAVVRNNAMNAFAAPAGYMFVFTGLILGVDHESDLAAVLAHELAHVSQRHLAGRIESMQKLSVAAMLGMLAGAVLGGGKAGSAAAAAGIAGMQSVMLEYSRNDEREADQIGMNYLVRAGYDPNGMVRAFEDIRKRKWFMGNLVPPYLSTHPGLDERIGYLTDRVNRLPANERDLRNDDIRFNRVKTLIIARFTDPDVGLKLLEKPAPEMTCLDRLALAIILERQNRIAEASEEFEAALSCGRDDSLVLREAGRFYFEHGKADRAASLLQKAILVNPQEVMALFFYARLLAEMGRNDEAIMYMQRVKRAVPEDPEVRWHLGRIYGFSGDSFHGHLELAYAELYQNNGKKAEFQKKEAERFSRTQADKDELEQFQSRYNERAEYW